ncbi:TonB-dependent receptor [Piscinibacter gummiphilus]|uniref:TonB-dependent receptor n=1 Tax=Piscinibacter gummiphilus TaxID=946333 RepID=A0ABZ0CQ14_9BURK|nr:TonB-dependent receptor [Piscinibacter gummiphilus]WOB07068.1 TonB-dependent receptor [Piscinibacter gummiphilus]
MRFSVICAALPALGAITAASAQSAPNVLDPVVITAQRIRESAFDSPAAITAVTREAIDNGGPQVNLSEVLNRVPGIVALNRQNYAQDLQISIRGFGTRSTFGVRGVRLIVDGIPATMPDGQGQASNVSLASAGRIEVLRGPMAQLYGNSAGGVVQVFTEDDATTPTLSVSGAAGPYEQRKFGLKYSTTTASGDGITLDASRFDTDGYREHSAARRGQFNARWQRDLSRDTHVSVVVNALDQPDTQDPLGLTRAQWESDPRSVATAAMDYDTRKTVRQNQIGTVVEHRFSEATLFTGRLYLGERNLFNALGIPLTAPPQASNTGSGGVVQFDRGYGGLGAQLSHRISLDEGRALRLTGGIEYDRMRENRQGYINNLGAQGALKRDERNVVENRDAYLQASLDVHRDWTLTAGARSIDVRFRTRDYFIQPGVPPAPDNPDDSGSVGFSGVNPVLGLTWHAAKTVNVYLNAGRGYETPTFTELAYRNVGSGLNTDLRASSSRHLELGAKWKVDGVQRLDAALYDIDTKDEIVVDTNSGGRSTFRNAGPTERRGLEVAHVAQLTDGLRSTLSLNLLRARFADGRRLPGTPERSAFAELAWAPKAAWGGFQSAVEVVHTGSLVVNDSNTDAAPAVTLLNLRAGFAQSLDGWRFTQLVRLDNATDRRYAGSVIVNEGNGRFFEPGLPRTWLLALTASHAF